MLLLLQRRQKPGKEPICPLLLYQQQGAMLTESREPLKSPLQAAKAPLMVRPVLLLRETQARIMEASEESLEEKKKELEKIGGD